MFQKALTWILLLNLLNTLFFAEVPANQPMSEKARVSASGTDAVIDSLVEFVLGYYLDRPGLMAEDDFDDTPDHLKRNKFQEFFLLPQLSRLLEVSLFVSRKYGNFQESLSTLSFDIFSPPPQA